MNPNQTEHEQMREIMLENQRLLKENNRLLKKVHNNALLSFWLRIMWFVVIVGLPFVVYYYVVEPYFNALGSSFGKFQEGLQEVPGWKQFYESIGGEVEAASESEIQESSHNTIEYQADTVDLASTTEASE